METTMRKTKKLSQRPHKGTPVRKKKRMRRGRRK
jgi:hypothetical protein